MTDQELEQIEKDAEAAASKRSDDFGHSVTALHEWQSRECDRMAEQVVPKLVAECRRLRSCAGAFRAVSMEVVIQMREQIQTAREALEWYADKENYQGCVKLGTGEVVAKRARAALEKIGKGEG